MNRINENYKRTQIKNGLAHCSEPEVYKFKRMYGVSNFEMHYDFIVDHIDIDHLDIALHQVKQLEAKHKRN